VELKSFKTIMLLYVLLKCFSKMLDALHYAFLLANQNVCYFAEMLLFPIH